MRATFDPHLSIVRPVTPRTPEGCEECLRLGSEWVHLRLCRTCGHVGCCDSSPRRHARAHSYAIGYPDPLSIWVTTNNSLNNGLTEDQLIELIRKHFKLTPRGIVEELDLRRPIYKKTAAFGHFGRTEKEF